MERLAWTQPFLAFGATGDVRVVEDLHRFRVVAVELLQVIPSGQRNCCVEVGSRR